MPRRKEMGGGLALIRAALVSLSIGMSIAIMQQ